MQLIPLQTQLDFGPTRSYDPSSPSDLPSAGRRKKDWIFLLSTRLCCEWSAEEPVHRYYNMIARLLCEFKEPEGVHETWVETLRR